MTWGDRVRIKQREFTSSMLYFSNEEIVWAEESITAEELLRRCIDLLSASCNRPNCRSAHREAATARGLSDQLGREQAEKQALERLLTRRVNGA